MSKIEVQCLIPNGIKIRMPDGRSAELAGAQRPGHRGKVARPGVTLVDEKLMRDWVAAHASSPLVTSGQIVLVEPMGTVNTEAAALAGAGAAVDPVPDEPVAPSDSSETGPEPVDAAAASADAETGAADAGAGATDAPVPTGDAVAGGDAPTDSGDENVQDTATDSPS